jgi:acyl-coenzyme A synthetase/AMP-(fatty) acid ligase
MSREKRFVDQFPQTASGKIQKFALQEIYLGAGACGIYDRS